MSTTQQSRPFAAVVFDMDGTLVDTEPVWDQVRRQLAEEDGVPWPEQATAAMMGMSTQEWSSYLSEQVGLRSDAEQSARRTIDALVARYEAGTMEVLPGAREAVALAASRGPVGIASSSPVVLIEAGMRLLGITEVVKAHVSTEQVGRGKPAPDGYLRCCELLQVDPSRCLALEDSSNGIRSALAAGMTTVAVPQPFHRPDDELLDRCAAVLDDLTGFDQALLERLAR
ncbi:HAD family phosphatase [Luteococcus peritonei]|uniref:HAD family hydrolase n=1 Tax=Luteococcus peritonei TaxID=88874 RepID=A0ABW4RZQ0_9ACTN